MLAGFDMVHSQKFFSVCFLIQILHINMMTGFALVHSVFFFRLQPSTLNKAKPSSEEVLEFLKILLDRLQRPPLLMEDAESKRRKFASTQQQTINIAPTEVAVGAA